MRLLGELILSPFLIIKVRNVNQKGGMRNSGAYCLPLD